MTRQMKIVNQEWHFVDVQRVFKNGCCREMDDYSFTRMLLSVHIMHKF